MVGAFIGFGMMQWLGFRGEGDVLAPIVSTWFVLFVVVVVAMAGLRGPRRHDRAIRVSPAAERAAYRAADQRTRGVVLPRRTRCSSCSARSTATTTRSASTTASSSEGFNIDWRPFEIPLLRIIVIVSAFVLMIALCGAGDTDAHGQGDARDVVRPRGGGDDGHRRRPRDRVHVRARVGARRRRGRDVRAPRARRR